jgi:hypothetical protein
MGRGSSTLKASVPDRLFSSSMSRIDGCLNSTALMVACTGDEDEEEENELVVAEDAEDDRRNDVRRFPGEKRDRIIWKREVCILNGVGG